MKPGLDSYLDELIQLAREDKGLAMSSPPPHAIRRSPYSWPIGQSTGTIAADPSEEKDLISRAVSARLARLWLDTLYESPFGSLYVSPKSPARDSRSEARFRELASQWEAVSHSGVQIADRLVPALRRWTSRAIPSHVFLLSAFETIQQRSNCGLARIIQSNAHALRGDWWKAAVTAQSALTNYSSTWDAYVSLLASSGFLLAGAPAQSIRVLRGIDDPRHSLAVNTLKLIASSRLRNRRLLAEANYHLGELGAESDEQIERSAERRLARSKLGLHQSPAPYGAVPEFRGMELCRSARRLLLWT